jgi:hypothetical protein
MNGIRLRQAHLGKKLSAETKEKMSKVRTGSKNPMYGKQLSEERKERIRMQHHQNSWY